MIKLAIATVSCAAVTLSAFAGLADASPTAPRVVPHVVGTWPDHSGSNTSGGWELWSNGKVVALQGAPSFGGAVSRGLNNFVGMVSDSTYDGYWLITSTGRVFPFGTVCQNQKLVGPRNAPKSGVVGAINLRSQIDEGFNIVNTKGQSFSFKCTFVY
jgi:hypothetical protein